MWRGWTSREQADEYVDYLRDTGVKEARSLPGHRGFYILRRLEGERAEFVTVILWESLDAIRAFAGEEIERAVFFPEDDRYLVDRELTVTHYEVVEGDDENGGRL